MGRPKLTTDQSTGEWTVYNKVKDYEIMFHVAPMLPYSEVDSQQLEKKRHIGNDIVVIIFHEGDSPIHPEAIKSVFNHAFVIVRPAPRTTPTVVETQEEKPRDLTPISPRKRAKDSVSSGSIPRRTQTMYISSNKPKPSFIGLPEEDSPKKLTNSLTVGDHSREEGMKKRKSSSKIVIPPLEIPEKSESDSTKQTSPKKESPHRGDKTPSPRHENGESTDTVQPSEAEDALTKTEDPEAKLMRRRSLSGARPQLVKRGKSQNFGGNAIREDVVQKAKLAKEAQISERLSGIQYSIEIVCKQGVMQSEPQLPNPPVFYPGPFFKEFFLTKRE